MTIEVETYDGAQFRYEGAEKWVIDDRGLLHVVGSKGNVASFNPPRWASVQTI